MIRTRDLAPAGASLSNNNSAAPGVAASSARGSYKLNLLTWLQISSKFSACDVAWVSAVLPAGVSRSTSVNVQKNQAGVSAGGRCP